MDNRERTEAAAALINWFNSQEIRMTDAEPIMYKVIAKIITSRLGLTSTSTPPTEGQFKQELLKAEEDLMHELVARIYQIHGRR